MSLCQQRNWLNLIVHFTTAVSDAVLNCITWNWKMFLIFFLFQYTLVFATTNYYPQICIELSQLFSDSVNKNIALLVYHPLFLFVASVLISSLFAFAQFFPLTVYYVKSILSCVCDTRLLFTFISSEDYLITEWQRTHFEWHRAQISGKNLFWIFCTSADILSMKYVHWIWSIRFTAGMFSCISLRYRELSISLECTTCLYRVMLLTYIYIYILICV